MATQVLRARGSCCQERFLTLDYKQTKWVFYLADSVLEFIVGYFKIIIDNYTMKITRFFSWSEKEKELEEEKINLGCLPFTQIIRLDILCVTCNEQIYQIIIVLLRIPNQFAVYKCCEQIQIGFRVGPENMITWIGFHSNGLAPCLLLQMTAL